MKRVFVSLVAALIACTVTWAKEVQQPQSYNYQRGVELIQTGKADEGIDYLKKELANDPKNGYAYAWMASAYAYKDERGTALHIAQEALKHLPKADKYFIAWTHCLIGQVYLLMQDTVQALESYSKAVKTEPRNEEWYEYRGHLYRDLKLWDKSDADFKQYIALTPGLIRGVNMYARNLYLQGRYEEALTQYQLANRMAERAFAYRAMAEIEVKLGRYEEAVSHLMKSLQMEQNEDIVAQLVEDCTDEEWLEMLEAQFHAQTLANPNELNWYVYLLHAQRASKNYEAAIRTCRKIQTINADVYFDDLMADLYYAMGDFAHALQFQNKAIATDSTDIGFRFSRAFTYCEMDSVARMYEDMALLIAQHPDDARLYLTRGYFHFIHGRYQEAIEDYTTGLAFAPDSWFERYQRGRCYEALGNTQKADKDYRYILTHASTPEAVLFAKASTGMREEAMSMADSLLQADPTRYRYNVACVYALLGENDRALALLEEDMQHGYVLYGNLRKDPDLQSLSEQIETLIATYQPRTQERILAFSEAVGDRLQTERVVEIPFTTVNGVTKVDCSINGLALNFIFDTGASIVTISQTEANFMFKNGYLSQRDIVGSQTYRTADGSVSVGTTVVLNHINFGGLELTGVRASVVGNQKAPLLLGQSVLKRLGKIEIDNERRVLKITTNE